MSNALFPNYSRAQEDALRNFRQTSLGRVVSAAADSIRRGRTPREAARQIARDLGRRAQYSRSAASTGDYRSAAQRRAEGRLEDVTDALSPHVGGIIGAMLRPNGIPLGGATNNAELAIAAALLEAFGWNVTPPAARETAPNQRPDWMRPRRAPDEFDYRREQPEPITQPRMPFGTPIRGYPEDDPVMTGEMIPVRSSNVHSIGYRWNRQVPSQGTLIVRFLDKSGGTTAPGPTYAYYDVHPQVFQAFRRAASKGKFVWDRLRIRGTVTGHQYAYRLIGLAKSGYVPRQATRYGNNEYFLQRQVRSVQGQTYSSSRPDELVGAVSPQRPGNGLPYRGRAPRVNRGR